MQAILKSDYSPDTFMKLIRRDDGDIIMKICGDDEMHIAMSGSRLHGRKKVIVVQAFDTIIKALNCKVDPCKGCPIENCDPEKCQDYIMYSICKEDR